MENKRKRITQTKEERIKLVSANVNENGEGFRVFVKNTATPKFVHSSSEEALKEAIRLAQVTNKTTWVAKFLFEIKPEKLV